MYKNYQIKMSRNFETPSSWSSTSLVSLNKALAPPPPPPSFPPPGTDWLRQYPDCVIDSASKFLDILFRGCTQARFAIAFLVLVNKRQSSYVICLNQGLSRLLRSTGLSDFFLRWLALYFRILEISESGCRFPEVASHNIYFLPYKL